jgi:multimeric flavodoxin WrbA
MDSLILNGNPRPSGFDAWVRGFATEMEGGGSAVTIRTLRDEDIGFCNGCWTCWWATPGRCVKKDGMETILREAVKADLIIYASPLVMGTASSLVKKAQDRFIPLVHPYIELVDGECHHRRRYPKTADIAFITELGKDDEERDLEIVRAMHERLARNMRCRFSFFATTAQTERDVAREAMGERGPAGENSSRFGKPAAALAAGEEGMRA